MSLPPENIHSEESLIEFSGDYCVAYGPNPKKFIHLSIIEINGFFW